MHATCPTELYTIHNGGGKVSVHVSLKMNLIGGPNIQLL